MTPRPLIAAALMTLLGVSSVRAQSTNGRVTGTVNLTTASSSQGELTLVAWHERIGEQRDRVTIRPGRHTAVTLTLPVLEAAK